MIKMNQTKSQHQKNIVELEKEPAIFNLLIKFISLMQDPTFPKNRTAKVSFTYRDTSPDGQRSRQITQEPPHKKICTISLRSRPTSKVEINNPQLANHQDHQVNTLKKQPFEVDVLSTTRKPVTFKTEVDDPHLECGEHIHELTLLREEIRFMRRKLIEAQNSEKDLRLQFELYRACNEAGKPKNEGEEKEKAAKSASIEEIHELVEKESKLLVENEELRQKIKSQQQKILDLQSRVIDLNKSKIKQEGSPDRNKEIQQLKKYLVDKDEELQKIKQELKSLEESYHKSEDTYTNELKLLECQKDKLQQYLDQQKKTRFELTSTFTQKQKQIINYQVKIEDITSELQNRMKDIDFLNQQSYNLDHSLAHAVKQIEELKMILKEKNEKEHQYEETIETMRDKTTIFEQKVFALEGEVQRLAVCIFELRNKHENILFNLTEDKSLADQVKLKYQQLQQSKEQLQYRQNQQESKNYQRISYLQGQLARMKGENTHLRSAVDKLESNQRVLMNELQWMKRQRVQQADTLEVNHKQQEKFYRKEIQILKKENQTNHQRQVEEIKTLQAKMKEMTDKFSQSTQRYEDNLNSVIRNYQHQLKRDLSHTQKLQEIQNSQNSLQQTLSGHTLSKKELSKVLQHLKNQPEITQQEHLKLKEQIETLQGELEMTKGNYQHEIKQMKNRYQLEIHQNNQEYSEQLNIYTQQIQKLMSEMLELKGDFNISKKNQNQVETIQEEDDEDEDCGVDERKVKRDLLIHGQDPADFYVSPPSNTPIKAVCEFSEQKQQQRNNSNYYLQDIIDLQTKIHSYIKNFNKKRSKDDHEE